MGGGKGEKKQTHLMAQNVESLDPTKLTALTPEVVSLFDSIFEYLLYLFRQDIHPLFARKNGTYIFFAVDRIP